jgi:uncharacterized protein YuzE
MKIIYDNETDSLYVKFTDDTVVESQEQENGTVVDYNKNDEVVAVEIRNIKQKSHEIDIPIVLKSA